ncbi:hypothetical protein HDU86_003962 [Geranomyces michiganensis]|nr:hypothetical protein HDU86_003962 [Geranomyces michiganensis]
MPVSATTTPPSSDEINYLIARYLNESGFTHSYYSFAQESRIVAKGFQGSHILPGALINLLHKGLLYLEVEHHTNLDGSERKCDVPFRVAEPHTCGLSESAELRPPKRPRKDDVAAPAAKKRDKKGAQMEKGPERVDKVERGDKREKAEKSEKGDKMDERMTEKGGKVGKGAREKVGIKDADAQEAGFDNKQAEAKMVSKLYHTSPILRSAWNGSKTDTLATGAEDGTLRVWRVPTTPRNQPTSAAPTLSLPDHLKPESGAVSITISAMEWAPNGEQLAAATTDGRVLLRNSSGEFVDCVRHHNAAIYTLAWSTGSTLFATGSHDHTVVIWQADNGVMRRTFDFHLGPVMTIDWHNEDTLATGSLDSKIFIFQFGEITPLKEFSHMGEINKVVWDPTKKFLASCSDDRETRIWDFVTGKQWLAKGHTDSVQTCEWSPGKRKLLVTGSADHTARLWDVKDVVDDSSSSSSTGARGKALECLHSISSHGAPVTSVAFSHTGRYLATASLDGRVNVWLASRLAKVGTGMSDKQKESFALMRWYQAESGSSDFLEAQVRWSADSEQLAISHGTTTVAILNMSDVRSGTSTVQ